MNKHELWTNTFIDAQKEGISLEIDDLPSVVSDFFIADKINADLFISNLEFLLIRGMPVDEIFSGKTHKPTRSTVFFANIANRPQGYPIWFLAAYPDVVRWTLRLMERYLDKHPRDYDGWGELSLALYGLDIKDPKTEQVELVNAKKQFRPQFLKNLVHSYRVTYKHKLETRTRGFLGL